MLDCMNGRTDTCIASLMGCEDINKEALDKADDGSDSIPHGMRGYKCEIMGFEIRQKNSIPHGMRGYKSE